MPIMYVWRWLWNTLPFRLNLLPGLCHVNLMKIKSFIKRAYTFFKYFHVLWLELIKIVNFSQIVITSLIVQWITHNCSKAYIRQVLKFMQISQVQNKGVHNFNKLKNGSVDINFFEVESPGEILKKKFSMKLTLKIPFDKPIISVHHVWDFICICINQKASSNKYLHFLKALILQVNNRSVCLN